MRYGNITCDNCELFFSFESTRESVACIGCNKTYNIESFPVKEEEEIEISIEEEKAALVNRLVDLGELWLTSVDTENVPYDYLVALEQTLISKQSANELTKVDSEVGEEDET